MLYDLAFDSKLNLARILAHEYAHKLYGQFSDGDARSYNVAADWMVTKTPRGEIVFVPLRESYVEEDGKEGPGEDFTNNIEYYLFKPEQLRSKSPKVYEWIRQRYGDNFRIMKGSRK